MTDDEMRREIMRLQGELSAACSCIADLYEVVIGFGSGDMRSLILNKISDRRFAPGLLELKGPDWRRGVESFNERLANVLSGEAVAVSHDDSVEAMKGEAPSRHRTPREER